MAAVAAGGRRRGGKGPLAQCSTPVGGAAVARADTGAAAAPQPRARKGRHPRRLRRLRHLRRLRRLRRRLRRRRRRREVLAGPVQQPRGPWLWCLRRCLRRRRRPRRHPRSRRRRRPCSPHLSHARRRHSPGRRHPYPRKHHPQQPSRRLLRRCWRWFPLQGHPHAARASARRIHSRSRRRCHRRCRRRCRRSNGLRDQAVGAGAFQTAGGGASLEKRMSRRRARRRRRRRRRRGPWQRAPRRGR